MGYKADFAKAQKVSVYDYCMTYEHTRWHDEGSNTARSKDMSSLIISRYTTAGKSLFFDNSCRYGIQYGDAIDYIKFFVYPELSQKDVVRYLADVYDEMMGNVGDDIPAMDMDDYKISYTLPDAAPDSSKIYSYLCGYRMIPKDIIDIAVSQGILYQGQTHHNGRSYDNAIFASNSYPWAEVRGVGCAKYCSMLKGSCKNGYWAFAFDGSTIGKTAIVCEGAIDALSLAHIMRCKDRHKASQYAYISTGGVAKRTALMQCIEDYDGNVIISPDNDSAGDENTRAIHAIDGCEHLRVMRAPAGKDWNDYLRLVINIINVV